MQSSGGECNYSDRDGGSQEARGVAVERKLPPQLIAVADLLIGEEAQPKGAAEDDPDCQKPPRRKRARQRARYANPAGTAGQIMLKVIGRLENSACCGDAGFPRAL